MYFEDFTPYRYGRATVEVGVYNIGWLSPASHYSKGACPSEFVIKLDELVRFPIILHRGSHLCEFCSQSATVIRNGHKVIEPRERTAGNGQIRVVGKDGATYAAPTLIAHYVKIHGYLPPKEFIDAVLNPRPVSDKPRLTMGVLGDGGDRDQLLSALRETGKRKTPF